MLCENKGKEMSPQEFWERLQSFIPPGAETTWEKLH
jgi:hypothetical protein